MFLGRRGAAAAVLSLCALGRAAGQTAAAPPNVALPTPVMSGPLAFSAVPPHLDAGGFGVWYLDGVFSTLGLAQGNPAGGDRAALADLGNAQIFVQSVTGPVRLYLQLGGYALPALGQPYTHQTAAADTLDKLFGAVPQAFVKLAPSENFTVQLGKLPSLLGGEYSFTFENVDITRGLLWAQEPAVSRGVQANLIASALAFSLSLNDGFYADRFTWLTASASWTIDPSNLLVLAAGGNLGQSGRDTLATPRAQNNTSLANLIYTYTQGALMLSPYLQYTRLSPHPAIGIRQGAASYGAALLASYACSPSFTLGGRAELETSTGKAAPQGGANLLFGPGSSAASLTLTPTYLRGHWFARAELAATVLLHRGQHDGFGAGGQNPLQLRGLLEAGYIF